MGLLLLKDNTYLLMECNGEAWTETRLYGNASTVGAGFHPGPMLREVFVVGAGFRPGPSAPRERKR